ncbi:hypothetical protein GCM10025867_49090 (plasmid) [Frondihabitans sucicola]|uniref:Competence protein CoiA nuclease-like domain-containing protein n=1 Tax=Frondihabitans sucicola TaxID=1268041 RepID=A0ABM8GW71_9MICO|nr:competence protein CoiA family protein [Frondihabitans sucicola]BDZ52668.1 hypothetical protein GCM10025867_49090 [Frondihabitans sucicola]
MPLTAVLDGQLLRAPQLSADEWADLRGRDMVMPCGARGVAKRSRLGTRFFAHWRVDCGFDHKPETEEHLHAKEAIIAAATRAGWDARDEVRAEDGSWIADVLVSHGARRVAFEVQWSRQGFDDYVRRTDRYARAGIETVWLIRHMTPLLAASQPVIELLPHEAGAHYENCVARPGADGLVPLAGVVAAYLDGRLAFAPRRPGLATTRVAWGLEQCWKCQVHSIIFSPSDIQSVRCDDCGHRSMAERGMTSFARFVQAEAAAGAPDVPMARLALRRTTKHPEGRSHSPARTARPCSAGATSTRSGRTMLRDASQCPSATGNPRHTGAASATPARSDRGRRAPEATGGRWQRAGGHGSHERSCCCPRR